MAHKKTARKKKTSAGKKDRIVRELNFLAQMDPRVRRWLSTPDPDVDPDDDPTDEHFDRWLLKRMADNQIMDVGGVLVDMALLKMRFKCVPEQCSPAVKRGKWRSCCADLTVYLVPAERARLSKYRFELYDHLKKREPRLAKTLGKKRDRAGRFFMDEDGDALVRPIKRCVFSKIDSRGRIRCHLHQVSQKLKIDQTDIQPITCRLFPVVLVHMPRGRVLVTAINRQNYQAWGGKHPKFFPCLEGKDLPPLLRSMSGTLDWLFGKGFTQAVRLTGRLTD